MSATNSRSWESVGPGLGKAGCGGGTKAFRFATSENPETGNEVTKRVTKDGKLSPANQEVTGLKHVAEWTEICAPDRPTALECIAAGQGTHYRRTDGGEVVEAEPADAAA